MRESESPITNPVPLKTLLSEVSEREAKARRKAVWYTVVPVVIGVLFLGVSLYEVSQLQQKATSLTQQIDSQTRELAKGKEELEGVNTLRNEAEAKLAKAQTALTKAQTALNDIGQNPKNAQQKARQALKELPPISKHEQPGEGTGPWAVAVAADKDFENAKKLATKAKQLGRGQILICQKQGWWRIVAVFASNSEARSNVGKIRASFKGDSAVRDMNKWCPGRTESEPGVCKCQN